MQPARGAYHLMPWPQVEVIGIGKEHLGAQSLQIILSGCLDRGRSPDRHEGWSFHRAVRRVQDAGPRSRGGVGGDDLESKVVRCHKKYLNLGWPSRNDDNRTFPDMGASSPPDRIHGKSRHVCAIRVSFNV